MPEQITNVINKVVEWWKKFSTRQRILIISITAVLLLSLIILYVVVSRPTMTELYKAQDSKEAATVKELLDSDSTISYEVSKDGLTFTVDEKDMANASMLLGSNDIPSLAYDITNVTTGSFTTTQKDKELLYKDFLEKKFADHISQLSNVESVEIDLEIPEDNGTILSTQEESSAAVILHLNGDMTAEQAAGLAQFVATQLGNDSTEKITIMDGNLNVLFSGANNDSQAGVISSQLSYKEQQANLIKSEIKQALEISKVYSNVEVMLNLDMNFAMEEVVDKQYSTPEGQNYGPLYHESYYESSASGSAAGVPGTDSNDDNTYVTEDDETTSSDTLEYEKEYHTNEKVTTSKSSGGTINYDTSSVTVVTTRLVPYYEETLEKSGELDEISFEEYKAQNSDPILVETDPTLSQAIATATGFPLEAITVLCYEQPTYFSGDDGTRSWSDIFQIILAVLIFALLGFVVFRSTRTKKVEEPEPELSVEALLESTVESDEALEDIGYTEKSETRILIEKFVDENPDAVAVLLRNWLSEEWE